MFKKIKFDLELDGKKVRTLKDIKDNFNISDILFYFKEGILERWLELNADSNKEIIENLVKLKKGVLIENDDQIKILEEDKVKIIKGLATIFDRDDYDEKEIRIRIKKNKQPALKITENSQSGNEQKSLETYYSEYKGLISSILDLEPSKNKNVEEMPFTSTAYSIFGYKFAPPVNKQKIKLKNTDLDDLKQNIKKLEEYLPLFKLDLFKLFDELIKEQFIAIFYLLANPKLREVILKDKIIMEALKNNYSLHTQKAIFEKYNELIDGEPFKIEKIPKNANKNINCGNAELMMINMENELVINEGIIDKEDPNIYKSDQINGNYLIFKEVNCRNDGKNDQQMIYIEV